MQIHQFTFGPFETNTYVLSFPSGRDGVGPHILLIDPACSNEYEQQQLLDYINSVSEQSERSVFCQRSGLSAQRSVSNAVCQRSGLSAQRSVSAAVCQRSGLSAAGGLTILATHGHLDHLWGAKWATDRWNVPVLIPEADIPMVKAMQSQYDLFGIRSKAQPFPIEPITKDSLPLGRAGVGFSILSTPGHTPGSICLYSPSLQGGDGVGFLFSGDTLFRGGYGRTDLPGGDTSQLIASLRRLATLPPDTQVFPGHGEATTIGAEFP